MEGSLRTTARLSLSLPRRPGANDSAMMRMSGSCLAYVFQLRLYHHQPGSIWYVRPSKAVCANRQGVTRADNVNGVLHDV